MWIVSPDGIFVIVLVLSTVNLGGAIWRYLRNQYGRFDFVMATVFAIALPIAAYWSIVS